MPTMASKSMTVNLFLPFPAQNSGTGPSEFCAFVSPAVQQSPDREGVGLGALDRAKPSLTSRRYATARQAVEALFRSAALSR